MSLEEIAEAMDCPLKTVSSRLVSAREKIRKAVITYEKKNDDRLHAVMPVPILTLILRKEAESLSVPDIPLELLSNTLIDAVAKASASTIKASTIAGGKVMTNALKIKILAGILAVTAVGGGATAVIIHNADKDKKNEQEPEAVYEVADEEGSASDDEQIGSDIYQIITDDTKESKSAPSEEDLPEGEELTPEAADALEKARASSEAEMFKFGLVFDYNDPNQGEIQVKFAGGYYVFVEESGDFSASLGVDKLKEYMPEVLEYLSALKVPVDDMDAYGHVIQNQIIAKAANRDGIYIDKVTFGYIGQFES